MSNLKSTSNTSDRYLIVEEDTPMSITTVDLENDQIVIQVPESLSTKSDMARNIQTHFNFLLKDKRCKVTLDKAWIGSPCNCAVQACSGRGRRRRALFLGAAWRNNPPSRSRNAI